MAVSDLPSASSSSTATCLLQQAPAPAVTNSTNKKKNKKQIKQVVKSVSFHDKVKMRKVRKLTDYDNESTIPSSELWYSREDLQETYSQVYDILQLMEVNDTTTIEELGLCTRGLESKTYDGHQHKIHTRYNAIRVVLDEQYRQWKLYDTKTMIDIEIVADLYSQVSTKSKQDAYQMALQDQQEVQQEAKKRKSSVSTRMN